MEVRGKASSGGQENSTLTEVVTWSGEAKLERGRTNRGESQQRINLPSR